MLICVKEKWRIVGGRTIQLSVTQSIVQPVWSDAPGRSFTRRTEHHNRSAVTAETTNYLKQRLSSRCRIQLAYHSFPFLDKKFEWMRKNNNNKQFFFPPHSCLSKWRTVRESIATSEWVRHPAAVPTGGTAILAWQMKTLSSLWEKEENTSSAAPPPPPAPASGSRAVIPPLPANHWQTRQIKSPLTSAKTMELLCCFPRKHVRQWLWCRTNLTRGASGGVGGILEQTYRIHFVRIMSITVLVLLCTFCLEKFLFTSKKCWDIYMTISPDNHIRGL